VEQQRYVEDCLHERVHTGDRSYVDQARSEASAKGGSMCASSNDKLGIKWDQQYAEFEEQVGMPERGRKLHNWKLTDEQWTLWFGC
jgi:hypothetical protein